MSSKFLLNAKGFSCLFFIFSFHLTVFGVEIKLPCFSKHGDMIINFDDQRKTVRLNEVPVSNIQISNNKISFDQNGKDYSLHRNTGILIVADNSDLIYVTKYQCSSKEGKF
tara:strand:- start:214 stop:546 length:333 start_codon:yes stop_codon:yes gene_type:complete